MDGVGLGTDLQDSLLKSTNTIIRKTTKNDL
jgi:hypothetical protein